MLEIWKEKFQKLQGKLLKKSLQEKKKRLKLIQKIYKIILGIQKFKFGELESEDKIGVVTGLAWTEYGGEILKIETVIMPGKGQNANNRKT